MSEEFELSPELTERAVDAFSYKDAITNLFARFILETKSNQREIREVRRLIYEELKSKGKVVDPNTEMLTFHSESRKAIVTKRQAKVK